jgi:hypothetical protein
VRIGFAEHSAEPTRRTSGTPLENCWPPLSSVQLARPAS